jgi:hypothetical protein
MKWTMWVAASVFAAATGAAAQSMGQMEKMDESYAGCIVAAGGGVFTLTHAVEGSAKSGAPMKHEEMKGEMKKDGGMAMKKDSMMEPASFTLTGSAVDFSKHVGQKVLVTGSPVHDMGAMDKSMGKESMTKESMAKESMAKQAPAFAAKSVKVLARSCS